MKKDVCVVIPIHKETLDNHEISSFKRVISIFSKRDIKIVVPESISTKFYEGFNISLIKVKDSWMESKMAYNKMRCDKDFYSLFENYSYILVYELDAWVFEDRLDYFIDLGYDYYGAPWPHLKDKVGNSGFCLQKINKMIDITSRNHFNFESIGKACDTWICINCSKELNICPLDVACNFSIESVNNEYFKKIKTIPMGLHGKYVMDLWDEDGTKLKKCYEEHKLEKIF